VGLVVVRGARRLGAALRPDLAGIRAAGVAGVPLLVRTVALRLTFMVTTWVATSKGAAPLAAHQVLGAVWFLLALSLDALAIAAQALTGRALGAGDVAGTRAATTLMVRWGVLSGVVLGAVLLALRGGLGPLFSSDPAVLDALAAAAVVAALMQPLAGYVFVLDGVLIGAGDGRYLALASLWQLLVYLPAAAAVAVWGPGGPAGLVWLWLAFTGWMVARGVFLGLRARGTAWMVTGAVR
jgi:Na+-driven multidrug efflux pump